MLIKVCGMRNPENIKDVTNLNVDYVGMIFYDKSPRYVTDTVESQHFNGKKKVGVFVNEKLINIQYTVEKFKLDAVQLHGDESPEFCKSVSDLNVEVFKAFGVDANFDFSKLPEYEKYCKLFVFDSKTVQRGGSGKKYDWSVLNQYTLKTGFLLSGGIGPNDFNKISQIEHKSFIGIDLNSLFEVKPGLKNTGLVENFIDNFTRKKI
jgi:phosphoribosylanthranilate isomerase